MTDSQEARLLQALQPKAATWIIATLSKLEAQLAVLTSQTASLKQQLRQQRRRLSSVRQQRRRSSSVRQQRRRSSSVRQQRPRPPSVRQQRRRSPSVRQQRRRPPSVRQQRRRPSSVRQQGRRPPSVRQQRRRPSAERQQRPRPPPRQQFPPRQPQGHAKQSQRPACLWFGRRGHTEADCRCKLLYQQSSPAKSQQKSAAIHRQTSRPVSTTKLTDPLPFSAVFQVTMRIPPEIAVAHEAACQRQPVDEADAAARDNPTADPTPVPAAETTGPQHPVPRRPTPAPRKQQRTQDPATQQVIPTGPGRPVIPRLQRTIRRHRPPAVTPSPVSSAITNHPGQSVPLSDTDIDTDTDSGIGLWKPYRSSRHKQCKAARDWCPET